MAETYFLSQDEHQICAVDIVLFFEVVTIAYMYGGPRQRLNERRHNELFTWIEKMENHDCLQDSIYAIKDFCV